MPRTESTRYRSERAKFVTSPRLFLRPLFVKDVGQGEEYAFARDLAAGHIRPWYQDVILADAPRGFWRLGEAGTNEPAEDESGNALHGVYVGSPLVAQLGLLEGHANTAVVFDGVDDYVQIADNALLDFAFNADFAVECWFKSTQAPAQARSLVEKWSGSGAFPYALRLETTGKISGQRSDGTNTPQVLSHLALNDGLKHYVVLVKSGASLLLYVDGQLSATATDTTSTTTENASALFLGRRGTVASTFYAGTLDEVAIYAAAPSAAVIQERYKAGADPDNAASRNKLDCVIRVQGNQQRIEPVQMRSEMGTLAAEVLDVDGEITRQTSDPAMPLQTAISDAGTPSFIHVDDIGGYPETGHVVIDEGLDEEEHFRYTAKVNDVNQLISEAADLLILEQGGILITEDSVVGHLVGITRAQRGTTAHAHAIGALVRNGEQLRRGVRISVRLGYKELVEAEYGPGDGFQKMEITGLRYNSQANAWRIEAGDVQRFLRRTIFETATEEGPTVIGPAHALTILLQILTSTGTGTNGAYDLLAKENGCGIPAALIDVAGIELVQSAITRGTVLFREIEPQDAKRFCEEQLLLPFNCVFSVTQGGKLSVKRLGMPEFKGQGVFTPNRFLAVA